MVDPGGATGSPPTVAGRLGAPEARPSSTPSVICPHGARARRSPGQPHPGGHRAGRRARGDRSLPRAPSPSVATIDGEAGIGKTTLWSFAVRSAAARGDRTLTWRASGAEQELAFTALMGLFDVKTGGGTAPEAVPDPGHRSRGRVRRLAPPRARACGGARAQGGRRGRSDPSLVGLAVVDVLRTLASHRSVAVAIDDAQWCDPASIDALAFAARRLRIEPVAFVFAVRTGSTGPGASAIELALPEEARGGSRWDR